MPFCQPAGRRRFRRDGKNESGLAWAELRAVVSAQPHAILFVTVSGAHLYGFPSADSDYDLRGAHILPAKTALGIEGGVETIEATEDRDGPRVELVTHDVKKYFSLLLKRNGYVPEQLLTPRRGHPA